MTSPHDPPGWPTTVCVTIDPGDALGTATLHASSDIARDEQIRRGLRQALLAIDARGPDPALPELSVDGLLDAYDTDRALLAVMITLFGQSASPLIAADASRPHRAVHVPVVGARHAPIDTGAVRAAIAVARASGLPLEDALAPGLFDTPAAWGGPYLLVARGDDHGIPTPQLYATLEDAELAWMTAVLPALLEGADRAWRPETLLRAYARRDLGALETAALELTPDGHGGHEICRLDLTAARPPVYDAARALEQLQRPWTHARDVLGEPAAELEH